jgi:hypothetical protein
VSQVLAPPTVTPGMSCIFTADPTQPHINSGALDIGLRQEYDPEILVANQTIPRGDPNQPQTETSFVAIKGGVVRITDTMGRQLANYTTLSSTTVPPSSGTTPGYSPMSIMLVDQATATSLGIAKIGDSVRVISYLKLFGQTLGGESVESAEFEFPVDVCLGCLVSYSSADISPNFPSPNCVGNGMGGGSGSMSVTCVLGQDFATDCNACLEFPICSRNGGPSAASRDAGTD